MAKPLRYAVKHVLLLAWLTGLLTGIAQAANNSTLDTVRVGILAKRGLDHCLAKWEPTAAYLSKTIAPYRFVVVPLDFGSVPRAVANKSVDFILTNSSSYVEMEDQYSVDAIATLVNRLHSGDHKVFGGVIFTRADNPDISTLEDLSGKNFMAVEETSMGGWRMAWREMKDKGIDPQKDFKSLAFGGTHDNVVYAVQNYVADAGTVRSDTLERMAGEGKIDMAGFRVLNTGAMNKGSLGILCSTRLYPEWPMAKLPHTPMRLSGQVAQALFNMPSDDPAALAAKCAGWTFPLSYRQVHNCLQELQLGPYAPHPQHSLGGFYRQYKLWFVFGGLVFIAIVFSAICVAKLNAKLSLINADLLREVDKRKSIEAGLKETQYNLESALAAANDANRAKGEFLANMSHELRTPLNGIIGMTGILQQSELTDEQTDYADTIMKSSNGLLRIINDILDNSNIEAGRLKLNLAEFDLYAMAEKIGKRLAAEAQEKHLVFTHTVDNSVPARLKGDARRLKQVIENLADNAIKFTHQGAVSVHVALVEESDTDCLLSFAVKDTGIGIANENKDQIFEPFSQADYSSTRRYGGTGLGLTLARHFIEMMGGNLEFESTPGKGSTFEFTVRFEKQAALPVQKRYRPVNITDKRILVVDDNPTNRQVLMGYLKTWQLRYAAVENARSAMAALHRAVSEGDAYDLIVVDHMMPEMDGVDLGRAIKTDPVLKGLKMVLFTSMMQEDNLDEIKTIGFDAFLSKPIQAERFLNCLQLVFSRHADIHSEVAASRGMITQAALVEARANEPRILVVEDNIINQKVVLNILGKIGCRSEVACNGREAVDELRKNVYDVVLMDLQMPEMNGFEAASAIRNPSNKCLDPQVPIIAVTANATKGNREMCLDAGMNDFLPKPVTPKTLMEKVQYWLETPGKAPRGITALSN